MDFPVSHDFDFLERLEYEYWYRRIRQLKWELQQTSELPPAPTPSSDDVTPMRPWRRPRLVRQTVQLDTEEI
jgi:hypothetical protein